MFKGIPSILQSYNPQHGSLLKIVACSVCPGQWHICNTRGGIHTDCSVNGQSLKLCNAAGAVKITTIHSLPATPNTIFPLIFTTTLCYNTVKCIFQRKKWDSESAHGQYSSVLQEQGSNSSLPAFTDNTPPLLHGSSPSQANAEWDKAGGESSGEYDHSINLISSFLSLNNT